MSLRDQWRNEHNVTWSDSTFESVERFVENSPEENIKKFVETGDLDDLFKGRTGPEPRPIAHRDYMREYAQQLLDG